MVSMEAEFSGTQSGHETIPEKPPDLNGGAKSFSINGTTFQGQISFRDKVLGTKSAPPIREKIDLLREKLVRIEYEDGNRLLPKVHLDDKGSAEHDNRKVSAEDIPTNMVEDGELPNRIISNVAPVNQVTRSSPQALHGDWICKGILKGSGTRGHMWDPTTLGSWANQKVMTVPKNIGKEKQVDAPHQTGSGSGNMKNKRARKSEEIHVMLNPLTLQDREGQLNRKKKNGSKTLAQSRKIRGKGEGEGPSRVGQNLPMGAFWDKGKEKLGLFPLEKDFVFGKSMLDESHKNIIQHNQANNMSFHDLGKIVQDASNMRSNLEALSNNSHLHTERGDKKGDTRMTLGQENEIDQ
ncbi:hypothetical protein OIU78_014319 [Salix suchowensis]|nr:hypothetical protein OIU78_014319 [Salix suchowensis]